MEQRPGPSIPMKLLIGAFKEQRSTSLYALYPAEHSFPPTYLNYWEGSEHENEEERKRNRPYIFGILAGSGIDFSLIAGTIAYLLGHRNNFTLASTVVTSGKALSNLVGLGIFGLKEWRDRVAKKGEAEEFVHDD